MNYEELSRTIINDPSKIIEYYDDNDNDTIKKISKFWSDSELKILIDKIANLESRYNTAQMVAKVLMNSLYGALGNRYFPLFNEEIAKAITGNGRYFIRKLAKYIEDGLQELHPSDKPYIVYGDTDSIYGHIEPFMTKYIEEHPGLSMNDYVEVADKFEKKIIQPMIKRCIDDFSRELNAANKDVIGAEREVIADAGAFAGKKSYFLRVRDNEGTRYPDEHPKIKVMGMDVAKSGTPKWSKKKLKEAIPIILDTDEKELKNWIRSIKHEFIEVPLSDITYAKTVNNLDYKLGEKGITIGARSALTYNKHIVDNNIDDIYNAVTPGEKNNFLFLREPNVFRSNSIAFPGANFTKIIAENNCVDYDKQFEKQFLNMLNNMTKTLGYNVFQETATLDDW